MPGCKILILILNPIFLEIEQVICGSHSHNQRCNSYYLAHDKFQNRIHL